MSLILTTDRLQLQPCARSDVAFLHTLWTIDCIRYYLFDDRMISLDEASSFIEASLVSFEQHHYGLWLIHHQDQCIGFASSFWVRDKCS